MAQRFILRFKGSGSIPSNAAESVSKSGAAVVDASPKMLLIEGHEPILQDWVAHHPGWLLFPEQHNVTVPETQFKVRKA
jgi:hypothetical protein